MISLPYTTTSPQLAPQNLSKVDHDKMKDQPIRMHVPNSFAHMDEHTINHSLFKTFLLASCNHHM
jgi:hypothetical protein